MGHVLVHGCCTCPAACVWLIDLALPIRSLKEVVMVFELKTSHPGWVSERIPMMSVGGWPGGGNQFYPTVRECDFLLDSSSSSYNFFLCHFLSAKICRRSINNLQRSRAGGWAGQVEVWAEETAGQTKSVHTCSTLYVCGSCFASSPHPLFYPFPWHTTYHQPPQTGLGFRILLQVFRGRILAGDMR